MEPYKFREQLDEQYKLIYNSDLEWILKEKPSFDTNAMDYLLSIGWEEMSYHSKTYELADIETKDKIDFYLGERKKRTPQDLRALEKRLFGFIGRNVDSYYDIPNLTLKDIQNFLAMQGLKAKNTGYKTLAHFVNTMNWHGLTGFKVKLPKSWLFRKDIQRKLEDHGLESTHR